MKPIRLGHRQPSLRICRRASSKVLVETRLFGRNAMRGIILEQSVQQVDAGLVETRYDLGGFLAAPFGEGGFEVREGGDTWPVRFVGSAEESVERF